MQISIQKWGNSLALRIPQVMAKEARLKQGGKADLRLTGGKLVIMPLARKGWTLKTLLGGITKQNLHGETAAGLVRPRKLVTMAFPERGDVVSIDMNPQAGHGQCGRRPALVLSPGAYNRKTDLAILWPLTTQIKGYPFEVVLPDGLKAQGAILADQVKSLDWRARRAELLCRVP